MGLVINSDCNFTQVIIVSWLYVARQQLHVASLGNLVLGGT